MNKIVSYPSVWSKINYIVSVCKRLGYAVKIVSVAESTSGRFTGVKRQIDQQESHVFFSSTKRANLLGAKFSHLLQWMKIILYLLCHVKNDDVVLVYHSIYNLRWLEIYKKLFRKKFILEIEDVFSELAENCKRFADDEREIFSAADACICVNDLIAEKYEIKRPTLVSYGSYSLPPYYAKTSTGKIRLVYAGVIERERNAAFLALNAMEFLGDNYELHILGFGDKFNIDALEQQIAQFNEKSGSQRIIYHGRKDGHEYFRFLQTCDIGLSTHAYDIRNMASADNTFPSKVLVYLANNLRVVAQRLKCLEASALNFGITYYDEPVPQQLADAIKRIDLTVPYDSRSKIQQMDELFTRDMAGLLKNSNSMA